MNTPELPDPFFLLAGKCSPSNTFIGELYGDDKGLKRRLYSADQMRVYGEACRASASSAAVGEKALASQPAQADVSLINEGNKPAQPAPVVSAGNVVQDAYRTLYGDRWQEPAPVAVDEREAFESEMRCEEVWGHRSLKKRKDGSYENWQVSLMWSVWKARAALQSTRSGQASSPARLICDSCGHRGVESEFLSAGTYICPACGDADVSEDGGDAGGEIGTLTITSTPSGTRMLSTSFDWHDLPDGTHKLFTTPQPAAVSAPAALVQAGQGVMDALIGMLDAFTNPESGEVDRRLAIKDARAALAASKEGQSHE